MSRRKFGGIFYLSEHQDCFVNSEFLAIHFELFFGKNSGQISKVALGATSKTFWGKTSFSKNYLPCLDFLDIHRKYSSFLAKNTGRKGILLRFLCVKGSTLKKDVCFKTSTNFAVFFRRRTKTNWIFPEKNSMFFTEGFCVSRSTFS